MNSLIDEYEELLYQQKIFYRVILFITFVFGFFIGGLLF